MSTGKFIYPTIPTILGIEEGRRREEEGRKKEGREELEEN